MPKVTLFKNYNECSNPVYLDLEEYIQDIRDGKWEIEVGVLRGKKTEEEQKKYKGTMPTVAMSGEFSYRDDKNLIRHNGVMAMDFDHLSDLQIAQLRERLPQDPYVLAFWISARGSGMRVLFRVVNKEDKHEASFKGLCNYVFENYGQVNTDTNGKNTSKPYIVSHDPTAFIKPNWSSVEIFKKYPKEHVIKKLTGFVHTTGDFDKILQQITGRGINICEDYQDWLKVGFALSEHFGEAGEAYFHEVSRMSPKYKYETAAKQYKACLKARGTTKINISTFYYLAKENGISISSPQTKKIIQYTKNGKRSGLKKEQVAENLKKFESIEGADDLISKLWDAPEDEGEDATLIHQLESFIAANYNLRMNEVSGYLEEYGQNRLDHIQLSASQLNSIFISAKKEIPNLDYNTMMRLLKSDFVESYNPFYEFFKSDGIAIELPAIPKKDDERVWHSPLIDKMAKCIKNNDEAYTHFFLRKWLVSVVSAAHKVHSPLLLYLLGPQGTGKTEYLRRMFPQELMMYYAESKLDKEKDDELLMTENLVIMDDELSGKSKTDALKLKNITSKQHFSVRRPYGDHNEKILRLAVLCGTSNILQLLSDPTGNRRVLPIEVLDIDKELYNSINKKELWLECFRLYKEGFDWRVTIHDMKYLNKDKDKYEQVNKEADLISKYFNNEDKCRLTSSDIAVEIEMLTRQRINPNIVGRELAKLGFEQKSSRNPGRKDAFKGWAVSRICRDEKIYTNSDNFIGQNQVDADEPPF